MLLTAVIGSLLAISFLGTGSAQQDSMHYTILAPSAFRVSTVYNVTATFYNVEAAVQLSLRLESENGLLVESEATLEKGVTEIISLQIPDFVPEATYTLYADGTGGLTFSNSHAVNVTRKTLSIFVQTDKAIYKPGQTVLFRAIVVHSDLKPSKESVNIDVYDQYGNVIEQWRDQTNDAGVISQKIVLSDQTPLGDCQIVVTAGENSFTKTFQVAVLPPIEVSVSVPSYLLLNDNNRDLQEDLPITVNAEYENGQPVKGGTTITIQLKPFDWEENPYYTKYVLDAQLVNGKAEVILKLKDITPDPWEQWEYRKLIVVADVNETVKGIIYSGNSTVYVRPEKYWLAFLPSSPGSFKPGFLYTGYFQLAKLDGSAPDLADITLPSGAYKDIAVQTSFDKPGPGYEHIGDQVISVTFTPTGIMNFSVMMDSNAGFVSFSIILNVDVTNSEIGSSHNIFAFASRDNQAIQVSYNSEDGLIKTNQNAVFTVITTEPITNFQYQIMSKGNILLSDNVVGDASTEHSFSIWISKELAVELAPKARVVVLFRTDAGEIVTDSTEISISDIFANEVSLSFDRESVTPSENVSVTINAYPGSYVGILAVDKSVLLLKPGNDISQETVSEDLSGYDSVPDDFVGSSDSSSILEKSGLFLLTDGFIYPKKMEDPPYLSDWSYANTHPRVKVPETWLWIDAITGPDGKVTIQVTVPDTKTSWVASAFGVSSVAGLGIAASTVNLNNVYETYDASGIDLNVKTTQNGNKITVTICTSWTNKEESGKMVMEVAELTGYDVSNLDDLKNRVQDIKRVEYKNGILFLYFDKLTAVETCVDVISDKVSPASSVKDAPIRVYPYPSRGRTVFYAHPQALSQTSP